MTFLEKNGEALSYGAGYLVIEEKDNLFGVITCRHIWEPNFDLVQITCPNLLDVGPKSSTISFIPKGVFQVDLLFVDLSFLKKELCQLQINIPI